MSYSTEELLEALRAADAAGDSQAATRIAERLNQQRVSQPQVSERGDMERRWKSLGNTDSLFQPSEASQMSPLSRAGAAMDYGLENVVYGAGQLAAHVLPGVDPSGIDATVRDREQAWQQGGLSDYPGATLARIGGEVGGYALPGAGAIKGLRAATALPRAVAPMAEGAAAGLAEGLTMPVVGENFWPGKAGQTAVTAGLGGGIAGGVQGLTGAGEAVVNVPRRAANLPGELAGRRVNDPMAVEGQRLANETGVQLTPAQSTGSRSLQFLEQRARESILSNARAAQGDLVRAEQFKQYVTGIAGNTNSAEFAVGLQGKVSNVVRDLARGRSKQGRAMYGEIDKLAGGTKVVQPRNLYDELTAIVQEAGTQEGGDVVKAATQARAMLETIDKQGAYSAQEALGRLQNYSPYSKGTVFDDVSKGYDAELKRRVYNALLKDMDETAAQGGTLGEMVKEANKTWRTYSEQIDAVHQSALGKMVGDEFATSLLNFNKVAPEQVMDQFMRLRPSQAQYVAKFMDENMPNELPKLRGSILNDAVDAAMEAPPAGGSQVTMNPAGFLRALGLTGGERGGESMLRLKALFGGDGSQAWGQLQNAIDVAKRMSDAYGKNFSGTSQANQFYQLVRAFAGSVRGALQTAGSTALEGAGLRRITESMDPASQLFGNLNQVPLLRAPRVIQRAPVPASVVGTPAAVGWNRQQQ